MPKRGLTRKQRMAIYRLIRAELLPQARRRFPELRAGAAEIRARLAKGRTLTETGRNGRTIGFVHLVKQGAAVWIDMLAVDRRHRGRGIGSRLLRRAEHYAAMQKAHALKLLVDVDNVAAIRFYDRNGFAGIACYPKQFCYEYVKPLVHKKRLPSG